LVVAITRSLNDEPSQVTLATALTALRRWQSRFDENANAEAAPLPAAAATNALPALEKSQAAYLQAVEELVAPASLRRWWPAFSLGAAAVFLPIADGDLEAVFLSHLHPRWLVDGGLAAGLIALCWFVGVKVFQPLVAGSVKRSLDFHVHPNRGRIADAV